MAHAYVLSIAKRECVNQRPFVKLVVSAWILHGWMKEKAWTLTGGGRNGDWIGSQE